MYVESVTPAAIIRIFCPEIMITENYILWLYLVIALGGAISAYCAPFRPLAGGIFYLTGIPIVVALGQLFLPQVIPWGAQLSLLLGYITLVQSWLSPSNLLDLTAAEKEELKACFTNDLFQLQSLQLEPDRVVCLGKCKTDRYQYIQQELQCRISHIYPERFHVVLAQRLFQPPSCYLLPVVRSQASVVVWSRILAVIGAILLAQNSWVYSLGLMGILGARELTRAKIGLRFKLSPLLTIPGGEDLPIVGMGRNLAIPPADRRTYFRLGVAPALVGLVLSLLLLIPGWLVALPTEGEMVLPTWLGQVLGAKLQGLPPWGRAGWHGLIITALGLLPIGSSEGGHLLHSLLGHSKAVLIGRLSRLVLFAISLSRYHILLFPALLLLWLDIERLPALNDVDELSEGEDLMAIGLLVLGILILFPGAG
ncbi:MAG: hypothetical protein CV045_00200 [Cyanobacteria bacterium M5B4]|nr:MAG: hypothetical protein CV045_00200 [Cyanobacteria bacterium M5B4]